MRTLLAALLSVVFLNAAALADPIGRYSVKGSGPGGSDPYTGTALVEKTGETYRITWNIDGARYVGTGIGNDDFIAISYRSKSESGLALYGVDGTGWKGIWTYTNGKELGSEAWTRQ